MKGALSCHFSWPTPTDCAVFETDLRITSSMFGTYFMAVGFSQGYFGIQDNGPGKTSLLFSVWDGNSNDPEGTPGYNRAQIHNRGTAQVIQRFGGEGCGLQAFAHFDFSRALHEILHFRVTATKFDDNWTLFSAWFNSDREKPQLIASYRSRMQGRLLRGFYSFIEDFRKQEVGMRSADFLPSYSMNGKDFYGIRQGVFTREGERSVTADGFASRGCFVLQTAGKKVVRRNAATKNRDVVHL